MKGLKGLSFNVTLSDEQMDHIASLAADKVHYTFQRLRNNDLWNEDKIKNLERELSQRDKLIVEKEFYIDRLRRTMDMYKKKLDELNPDNR